MDGLYGAKAMILEYCKFLQKKPPLYISNYKNHHSSDPSCEFIALHNQFCLDQVLEQRCLGNLQYSNIFGTGESWLKGTVQPYHQPFL